MTTPTTVTEITETDTMHREINRGLMVAWINADLLSRHSHDVRRSIVLYDDVKMFAFALPGGVEMDDEMLALLAGHGIRYYSRGIV